MNAAKALLLAVVCAAPLAGGAQARAGQAGVVTAWGVDDIPLVQPGTRFKAVAAGVQLVALTTESRKRAAASSTFHGPTAVAHAPRRQSSARSAMSIVQRVAWAKLRQERHIRIARSRGQHAAPGGA